MRISSSLRLLKLPNLINDKIIDSFFEPPLRTTRNDSINTTWMQFHERDSAQTQWSANAQGGGHMAKNTFFRFHVYCRSFMIPYDTCAHTYLPPSILFPPIEACAIRVPIALQIPRSSLSAHKLQIELATFQILC